MVRLLTFREVHERVRPGASERAARVFFWRLIRKGKFPAPLQLSSNRIVWRSDEVEAWLASRPRVRYAPQALAGRDGAPC